MLLEPSQITYPELAKYELQPIELFTAIYLKAAGPEVKNTEISYEQAVEIICATIEVIGCIETPSDIKRGVARMFEEDKPVTCNHMLSTYRDNFEHGRFALREALQALCHQKQCALPVFDLKSATILNQSILALLRMSNIEISKTKSLYPMFNSLKSGSSFNRIAFALIGYTAPSFILIKHTYETNDGKKHRGIIGAYMSGTWKDELGYQGDNNVYLFTILPKIKFLYAYKGKGGSSFAYLSTKKIQTSKYKAGLGFGGQEFKDFRLWIDDDVMEKSYCLPTDDTYPNGTLNEGYEEKLKVLFSF